MRVLAGIISVALGVSLMGCGGSSTKSTTSQPPSQPPATSLVQGPDVKRVEDTARAVITDPGRACGLLTVHALGAYTGGAFGRRALSQCRATLKGSHLPTQARITVLSLSARTAGVGYSDDRVLAGAMVLVNEGGRWLVDTIAPIEGPACQAVVTRGRKTFLASC